MNEGLNRPNQHVSFRAIGLTVTWAQFHGSAYRRILRLRSQFPAYVQAPNFCASLVTQSTHAQKPNFAAKSLLNQDIYLYYNSSQLKLVMFCDSVAAHKPLTTSFMTFVSALTSVRPPKGEQGLTMWLEVTKLQI